MRQLLAWLCLLLILGAIFLLVGDGPQPDAPPQADATAPVNSAAPVATAASQASRSAQASPPAPIPLPANRASSEDNVIWFAAPGDRAAGGSALPSGQGLPSNVTSTLAMPLVPIPAPQVLTSTAPLFTPLPEQAFKPVNTPAPATPVATVATAVAPPPPPAATPGANETITIASFNIQVFGSSKENKPEVMTVLAQVARRFDVLAIQEVRCKDEHLVPRFVELINAAGARYDSIVGPRLGRTSSKEQYAVIFNTARIELNAASVYTIADPNDRIQRPPLVANFRARGPPGSQAFSFTLVDIHTTPDKVDGELDALADVFQSVQQNGSGEDDVILLGDLNADEHHFRRLGQLPNIAHAIVGQKTNTRQTEMYDNLVFNRVATVEFTGQAGVLNLIEQYGLTLSQALEVSDHFPVWATFSIYENRAAGPLAGRPVRAE